MANAPVVHRVRGRAAYWTWVAHTDEPKIVELTNAEQERLSALTGQRRADFLAGRQALRWLTGQVTGVSDAEIRVRAMCTECGQEHGQPWIRVTQAGVEQRFSASLSHVGTGKLAAISPTHLVGIDGETLHSCNDHGTGKFSGLAPTILNEAELFRWQRLTESVQAGSAREKALARSWVRKEALLKAAGKGLLVDPTTIRLNTLRRTPRLRVREVGELPVSPFSIHIQDLVLEQGQTLGALALVKPTGSNRQGRKSG